MPDEAPASWSGKEFLFATAQTRWLLFYLAMLLADAAVVVAATK